MEKLLILMDKFIKDELIQKKFQAYLGPFVAPSEEVEENAFLCELKAFISEHPEYRDKVILN